MNRIPILKAIKLDYKKDVFTKDYFDDDFFEIVSETHPSVILDMFAERLEVGSKKLKLLESQYFRLSNEKKYLNFIKSVFLENNKKCIVNIKFNLNDYDLLIYHINELDIIDKHILLRQFRHFEGPTSKFFRIEDLSLLEMFMKGILREVFPQYIALYFDIRPLLLFSNYDMSLPLVFKYKKDAKFYENMAKNNELHFR